MKLLIVEDEESLLNSIISYFVRESYVCESVDTYEQAVEKVSLYDYDCLLIDISLPDGNGLDLLRLLQTLKKSQGVIIISAKDSLADKIQGLDLGADDYLAKPFHLSELNARVKSVIRRKTFATTDRIYFGNLLIDPIGRQLWVGEQPLVLTRKQLDIFLYLLANQNRVVTKTSLAEQLWGDQADQADSFDFLFAHIKNLKKKLVQANAGVEIQTVYGVGYKLVSL